MSSMKSWTNDRKMSEATVVIKKVIVRWRCPWGNCGHMNVWERSYVPVAGTDITRCSNCDRGSFVTVPRPTPSRKKLTPA